MAFDQSTRNRLAHFVNDARILLTEEFTRQLQNEYGLDPDSGGVTGLEKLTALDDTRRETARILRETLDYYLAGKTSDSKNRQEVLQRIVREQAFTILNRLCALRMAESRGILIESIARGYQSKGFQLYARLAGTGLGETGDAYSSYLFSLFDEFAVDLAVLFDRFSPQGRLFPRQTALIKLLELVNDAEIDQLWAEDETIGWMYQYFNTKEERQEMRAASQAPRNSRELAVRNQFFTPRYVVEFLTDNTLGRIWYEMTRGETALKSICRYLVCRPTENFLTEGEETPKQESTDEGLSQEELLKQPVYIPHRPLKDPRELKMLDPACGSMHFGLYAFDLFEQIYAEAWDLEERLGKDALWRVADLDSLHITYPDRETFLRDVPRLIIERNIHGVDIDPRAVQIAGLSLWLRAQRSWQAQGMKPQERPQICRSNIVCAEPMPGDRALLEEFLQTLKEDRLEALMRRVLHIPDGQKVRVTKPMADALANLVRTVWQEMELAGDAGSLLKIEETLREAITIARQKSEDKAPLFRVLEYGLNEPAKEQYEQIVPAEEQNFWNWAEMLVLAALKEYSEHTVNGGSFRRRLFAEDAGQGFAFIDLCRRRYDVILMNPPFGETSIATQAFLEEKYPISKHDLAATFIERFSNMIVKYGSLGAITTRTPLFLFRSSAWRNTILLNKVPLQIMADFGVGVLDATVQTAAYIIRNEPTEGIRNGLFFRLLREEQKELTLETAIIDYLKRQPNNLIYSVEIQKFSQIPGSPLAYWISNRIRNLFRKNENFENSNRKVRCGLGTLDDFRFVRNHWEVDSAALNKNLWATLALGGDNSPYLGSYEAVTKWENNGKEVKAYVSQKVGSASRKVQSETLYFKPGLRFPRRTKYFAPNVLPADSIFSTGGQAIIAEQKDLFYLLAIGNSKPFRFLVSLGVGLEEGAQFEVGLIGRTPYPSKDDPNLNQLARSIILLRQTIESWDEISRYFSGLPLPSKNSLISSATTLLNHIDDTRNEIHKFQDLIDKAVINLYEINTEDQKVIYGEIEDDIDFGIEKFNNLQIVRGLISEYLGLVIGRWDIRVLVDTSMIPNSVDPFDPLPACPPGMFQNNLGLPAAPEDMPANYPLRITWNGILSDDEGHTEDIEGRIREALHVVWGERAEAIEAETCQVLGVRSLNEYFQKPTLFFADHLKRYSKSRRQAPIYWPLSTPSNSYTLWLYYHRLNDQTLFTCVNDFVDPKLKQVSEEASQLRQKKGRTAADEKELERLTYLESELKDFRNELLRVAKFWKPDLNDGVQITAAPLWKLFQHRPWQKKLKETWESLEAGEYDWAYLAYSIWPERVREKCKTDKSLAIAHDLEHLYVEPKTPLKKKAGRTKQSLDASLFETTEIE